MINFLNDFRTYFNFLKISKNKEAFFIDNKYIIKYLKPYIKKRLHKKILIISFEDLQNEFDKIKTFTFKTTLFRSLFFLTHKLKTLYSSTPGLNKTIFVKTKFYNCKYIYLQHSPVSLTMAYPDKYFDEFDAIETINRFQYNEISEIKKKRKLKCKIFRSKYNFLLGKKNKNYKDSKKFDVLIAPSWNTNFYKLNCHKILIDKLNEKKISYILRPHHMSFKKKEVSENDLKKQKINYDIKSELNFNDFKILISDWSGIIYENSLINGQKSLLLNTPQKINNHKYKNYQNIPIEIKARHIFGKTYNIDEINELVNDAKNIINKDLLVEDYEIKNFLKEFFY